MPLSEDLLAGKTKLAIVGLGYVGMPLAVEFAKHLGVIGFDINDKKISEYKKGIDPTNEVGNEAISETSIQFTSQPSDLKEASFFIVAVPTPINQDKTPNLDPIIGASMTIGRQLSSGSVIVYESTVYPGVTEDVCIPILEEQSGLVCGVDFKVGYSPERINPGDRIHTLKRITKIVAGQDEQALEEIKSVYDIVIEAGTYPVSTIKTAEAIKVVENSQRDINIAFMNELAMVFDRMGIDTNEVVGGMNTKWNALGFRPGLVGGHCIGVDPYYFTYEAEKLGYHSQIILAGRKVNDGMGEFVANAAVREMVLAGLAPARARVGLLGLTFKEDCPDVRNSKVEDVIATLTKYGISPLVYDPWADPTEAQRSYGIKLSALDELCDLDCLIIAVAHSQFKAMTRDDIASLLSKQASSGSVIIDVKSILDPQEFTEFRYWRL